MDNLPRNHFRAILADPPWHFYNWSRRPWWERTDANTSRAVERHYETMSFDELSKLAVSDLAAEDCVIFLWSVWPSLPQAIELLTCWGFEFKTCGFLWAKAHANQLEMFQDHIDPYMGLGYWTRANSEPCLLGTRGNPKRVNADVKQVIIEPRREHSRKPDCIYERIERLVEGPYLELFARTRHSNWTSWGNETSKFNALSA